MKLEFSGRIFEKKVFRCKTFMKILPVGAELYHTDGQTDMTKLIVALRTFANAPPKKLPILLTECIYMFRIVLHNKLSVYL